VPKYDTMKTNISGSKAPYRPQHWLVNPQTLLRTVVFKCHVYITLSTSEIHILKQPTDESQLGV